MIRFFAYFNAILLFKFTTSHILSEYYSYSNSANICGKIEMQWNCPTVPMCVLCCRKSKYCKAFLFKNRGLTKERCNLILSNTNATTPVNVFEGFVYYARTKSSLGTCSYHNKCLMETHGWGSSCPKLYHSFDDPSFGTVTGPVQYISSVKGGFAYSFFNASASQGYLNIGMFPHPEYCFPAPHLCDRGVSYAFWLYLPTQNGECQTFVTTLPKHGVGFAFAYFIHDRLQFLVKRDLKKYVIIIEKDDFLSEYNFSTWIHCAYKFKFNPELGIAEIDAYLDGKRRPDAEKYAMEWPDTNTYGYDGRLDVGHLFVNVEDDQCSGNMQIDELYIWEEELLYEDILQLYDA